MVVLRSVGVRPELMALQKRAALALMATCVAMVAADAVVTVQTEVRSSKELATS